MKHNKTSKKIHKKPKVMCEVTLSALQTWYEHLFEKLGWMILAHKRGMMEKIMNYKHTVQHFEKCVQDRMCHVNDKDAKMDLQIMLDNIGILKDHIAKDF